MYLSEMLYVQDLVDEKLREELHLRNLVAHLALSKRLHEMKMGNDMEYDTEYCVPTGKTSESFAEFLSSNHPGTNASSSTASLSSLCEQYEAMTLYNHGDKKETS
jgi:hypothetical protein